MTENGFISQVKYKKNRLKITGILRWVHLDASFLVHRGYFRLLPVGAWEEWQAFWDVWRTHKPDLIKEGVSVKKESGGWVIHYRVPADSDIELDESITDVPVCGQ